jgi:hypothetical protein
VALISVNNRIEVKHRNYNQLNTHYCIISLNDLPEASSIVGLGVGAVTGDVSTLTTGIALPGFRVGLGAVTGDVADLAALVAALLGWGLHGLGAIPDQMTALLAVVARACNVARKRSEHESTIHVHKNIYGLKFFDHSSIDTCN